MNVIMLIALMGGLRQVVDAERPGSLIDVNRDRFIPTLMLTNANRLLNKLDELFCLITDNSYDLICITETWLSPEIPESVYQMPNFISFRRDRSVRQGGGVLCYVRSCLNPRVLEPLANDEFELTWVAMRPSRLPRPVGVVIVAVLYCPPWYDAQTRNRLKDHLVACIDVLTRKYNHAGFLITGDFNSLETDFLVDDLILGRWLRLVQEVIEH